MFKVVAWEDGDEHTFTIDADTMEVVDGGMMGGVLTFFRDDVLISTFNSWNRAWLDDAIKEEAPLQVEVAIPGKDRGPKN